VARTRHVAWVTVGVLAALVPAASAADSPRPGDRFFALSRAGLPHCPVREIQTVRAPVWLNLGCPGLKGARVRVIRRPLHGRLGRVNQRLDRARYTPDEGFRGTDRIVVARRRGQRTWRTAVLVRLSGRSERPPSCRSRHAVTRFRSPVKVTVVCRGAGLEPLRVARGPFSGRFDGVRRSGGSARRTLSMRVRPGRSFVGQDVAFVRARGRGGTEIEAVPVSTLPWRFRALGDSVTAGFGYFENGNAMKTIQLPFCKPPAVVTNRCSSNSDEGTGYTGPPEWSADFGLANNVSWAAQFANDLQGGVTAPDMFQNLAVTGSAPSDWLDDGILDPQLQAIVAEDPELIAFTIGANPLLTEVLLTTAGESCAFTNSVPALEKCIEPFFTQVQLVEQLQRFYQALLEAPNSLIVTFQYHLAVPSVNLFANWQLEALTDYFNAQLATAVDSTKAAQPSEAKRLMLIQAQTTPGTPLPTQLPRFNLGLPPSGQSWTPPYNCGANDFVDGQSHQSDPTQTEFHLRHLLTYCEGPEWIIGTDSGIHPNTLGYTQFAATLENVLRAQDALPQLPASSITSRLPGR
jgi:lysophospholipase L1-like esterase